MQHQDARAPGTVPVESHTQRKVRGMNLEHALEEGIQTAKEALLVIHDDGLWEDLGYGSWSAYCFQRWDMTPQQASQTLAWARGTKLLTAYNAEEDEPVKLTVQQTRALGAHGVKDPRDIIETCHRGKSEPVLCEYCGEDTAGQFHRCMKALETLRASAESFAEWSARQEAEFVGRVTAILGIDADEAADVIDAAEPLWDALSGITDGFRGTQFFRVFPEVLALVRRESNAPTEPFQDGHS